MFWLSPIGAPFESVLLVYSLFKQLFVSFHLRLHLGYLFAFGEKFLRFAS